MRGISIQQPRASFVAWREKRIETRGPTFNKTYRGPVLVHASKSFDYGFSAPEEKATRAVLRKHGFDMDVVWAGGVLPSGAIIALANITDVIRVGQDGWQSWVLAREGDHEVSLGDFSSGRTLLYFEDVHPLREPIPWPGALGLWKVPEKLQKLVGARL